MEREQQPLRIITLCYEFPPIGGGGSKVVRGLSSALVAEGHAVDLVTTRFGGAAAFEVVDGIQVSRVLAPRHSIDHSNLLDLIGYVLPCLWRAWRLTSRNAYDVCHAHFIFPDGVVAWVLRLLTRQRYIITAHGSDVPGYNPDRFRLAHRILRPLWRKVVKGAETIIVPSPSLRDLLRSHCQSTATTIIPNGFDPQRFRTELSCRDRSGVLCVSRLLERKGLQHLLSAVAGLDVPTRINVAGDGPYRAELERHAKSLSVDVVFHGWLDNDSPALAELYRTCGIFVLPSSSENFPVSLLEAMSAGMAIVTTEGTGCEDVVGDAGVLVAYGDVAGLRAALGQLTRCGATRESYGARARQRLIDRFAWPHVVQQYLAVYRRCPAFPSQPANQARLAQ